MSNEFIEYWMSSKHFMILLVMLQFFIYLIVIDIGIDEFICYFRAFRKRLADKEQRP